MFAEDDSSGADASSRSAPLPPPSPNATGRMGSELVLQEEQPAAPPSGGALVALAVLPGLGAPTQYNTTYPRSKLWEDPDAGCQKKCCQTQGRYLTLQIGDKQGDELKKARKAKQKKDMSAKFPTLQELREEKHLNYTIPVGEDETTVIKFDSTSIGQQMLQCVDHQFFAGFTQEQLDTLVSTGTVHPQTLLKETKGTYHLHTLNYMHLRGWKLAKQYQKFVLLASAGEIVHHVDGHAMDPDAKAQKKTQFESLLYIQKKGKKRSTPFKGKWNELSEFCRDFYRTVVLAPDSRVEFKKCILEVEGLNAEDPAAKLLDTTSLKTLRARAKSSTDLKVQNTQNLGEKEAALAALKRARDLDYSTETNVLNMSTQAWAVAFTEFIQDSDGDDEDTKKDQAYNAKCVCRIQCEIRQRCDTDGCFDQCSCNVLAGVKLR